MAMTWCGEKSHEQMQGTEAANPVNELTEIEVDEVSLVDRPATGRRFVLFKRGGLLRKARSEGESGNICSQAPGPDMAALTELQKRAESLQAEVARLRDTASGLEERLAALEAGRPARQSEDAAARREGLWAGVL